MKKSLVIILSAMLAIATLAGCGEAEVPTPVETTVRAEITEKPEVKEEVKEEVSDDEGDAGEGDVSEETVTDTE